MANRFESGRGHFTPKLPSSETGGEISFTPDSPSELPSIEEAVQEGMRLLRGELLRVWDDLANETGWGPDEPREFVKELSVYGEDYATTRPLQEALELYQDQQNQEIDESHVAELVFNYERSINETPAWKGRYGTNADEIAHKRARRLIVAGGLRKKAEDGRDRIEKFTVQDYIRYWKEREQAA